MVKYEDECVDCGLPCVSYCKYKHVPHYYCDCCDKEFKPEKLYVIDGDMICEECAAENITFSELLEVVYGTLEV